MAETDRSSSGSRTSSRSSDGDDGRAASTGSVEEPHPPGQQPLSTTAIPSLHGDPDGDDEEDDEDASHRYSGNTFDEIMAIMRRHIDPESIPPGRKSLQMERARESGRLVLGFQR